MRHSTFTALAAAAILSASMAHAQDRDGWPSDLTVGTASQGGTYFVYGNGLASFIGEEFSLSASGEVTGGPVQNVTLVQTGEHEIGSANEEVPRLHAREPSRMVVLFEDGAADRCGQLHLVAAALVGDQSRQVPVTLIFEP